MDASDEKKKFKCQECDKSFFSMRFLKHHQGAVHQRKKDFPRTVLASQSKHVRHMRLSNKRTEALHKCPICSIVFGQKAEVEAHFALHTGEDSYECKLCRKVYTSELTLTIHMWGFHGYFRTGLKCSTCGKGCSDIRSFKEHQCTVTMFWCGECGKRFPVKGALDAHITANHQKVMYTGANTFHFEVASPMSGFTSKAVQISNQSSLRSKDLNGKCQQSTTLNCVVCGDEPGLKSSLVDQIKPQMIGMRYMCPKCDITLESEDNLDEYLRKAGIIMHSW